jgi:hypothetical protein
MGVRANASAITASIQEISQILAALVARPSEAELESVVRLAKEALSAAIERLALAVMVDERDVVMATRFGRSPRLSRREVEEALSTIGSGPARRAFLLHVRRGRTDEEIGQRLGIAPEEVALTMLDLVMTLRDHGATRMVQGDSATLTWPRSHIVRPVSPALPLRCNSIPLLSEKHPGIVRVSARQPH